MNEKNIKTLAKEAKQRFKKGFWKDFKQTKRKIIFAADDNGIPSERMVRNLIEETKQKIKEDYNESTEDDEFLARVLTILIGEQIVLNPISRLIDQGIYDSLSESEKQKYTLDLADKFNKAKQELRKQGKIA